MERIAQRAVVVLGLLWTAAAAWSVAPESGPIEEDLVLVVGDTVEIQVERHEKYSGPFRIASDGTIDHPLIGPVPAKGLTAEELQESLVEHLSRYIRRPMVKVALAEPERRPGSPGLEPTVYLMGEVRKAGPYPLGPGMTLLQLMALSGGAILHPMQDHLGNIRSTGADLRNI